MIFVQEPELLVLLAAIGAAVWFITDARRRRAPVPLVAVGVIDFFCGLLTFGLIALHLGAVVGRAVLGSGSGVEARFEYDFRFYSLVLVGVLIIIPGLVCMMHARRLTKGDVGAWKRALWASVMLLLINGPLGPIQGFAIGLAGLAGLNLVALWAGRKQFRAAST